MVTGEFCERGQSGRVVGYSVKTHAGSLVLLGRQA